jgi:hypothetical protein
MRMHVGSKVAALGLAAVALCGAAGTAFAASGGSSTATTAGASAGTASSAAVKAKAAAQQPALVKMTMTQLTEKLGVSQKQMVFALDDVKTTVSQSHGLTTATVQSVMNKILAKDLGISSASAAWANEEIDGGYIPTQLNWGFPTSTEK